jgi:16S rRNA (guanine527-N7)-methyltransferase
MRNAGASVSSQQLELLSRYFGLLTKWNKTVNLTALKLEKPEDETFDRLFVEPFLAARIATGELGRSVTGLRLLDVGSGGGSPAIPLAVALGSAVELTMVESRGRKAAFLREVVRQLPLDGAQVMDGRLEKLEGDSSPQDAFDLVSIRAVRADQSLWKTLARLVRSGGLVIWFRSPADGTDDSVFFPHFLLHSVRPLPTGRGSELAVLRKP